MRVVLVGAPRDRARMRAQLDESTEVIGEFDTLAAARSAATGADAMLLPAGANAAAGEDDGAGEPVNEGLTPREIEVLELLAQGLPNKAIAVRLGISDQTVKFHVASLSGKLGAVNRTDAVRRAVRRGLVAL
jgi:DNA-binding NarL/FixJ family response regulator